MLSNRKIFSAFLLLLLGFQVRAYELKPVIIQLYFGEQPDTVGFNLVDDLPGFLYTQFELGNLTLYDSPAKKIKISFETLRQIEQSNKSKAAKIKTLFIHELWTLKKHQLTFFPVGITLSDYDEKGNVIAYGYVDLEEAFPLLNINFIHTNANGPAYLTYWEALKSRRYNYQVIQYGKQTIHNKEDGQWIKEHNLYKGYKTSEPLTFAKEKLITYEVKNSTERSQATENLLKKLNEVFKNHRELFDTCKIAKNAWGEYPTIAGIQVKEIWAERDGFFEYKPISVNVFFEGQQTCNLLFSSVPFTDFRIFENDITSKLFNLTIININGQEIKPDESPGYIYAMRSAGISWSQLTTFVKHKSN